MIVGDVAAVTNSIIIIIVIVSPQLGVIVIAVSVPMTPSSMTLCALSQVPSLVSRIQACVSDVRDWMTKNKLQLNDEKTEALIIIMLSKVQQSPTVYSGRAR